jgi:hypothetical protein
MGNDKNGSLVTMVVASISSSTGGSRLAELKSPRAWADWPEWLAAGLHGQWRLPIFLAGIHFARPKQTVASWLRVVFQSKWHRQRGVRLGISNYMLYRFQYKTELCRLFTLRGKQAPFSLRAAQL